MGGKGYTNLIGDVVNTEDTRNTVVHTTCQSTEAVQNKDGEKGGKSENKSRRYEAGFKIMKEMRGKRIMLMMKQTSPVQLCPSVSEEPTRRREKRKEKRERGGKKK